MKKKFCFVLLLFACLFLSGCNTKELEDRSFPLAIGLDKAGTGCRVDFYFPKLSEVADENAKKSENESFRVVSDSYYEAWRTYEADSENTLDYNHLKVLVFGMDFLEDERQLENFLKFSMSQENFSRNTLVFVASPDASQILSLNEGLDTPIGTYLEQMEANSNLYKAHTLPTLGDLYNEYYNRDKIIFLPVLSDDGGIPVIDEYYILHDFKAEGTVEQQIASEGLLLQNKLKEFSMKLDAQDILKLEKPYCTYEISEEEGNPLITVKIKSQAFLMNRSYKSTRERKKMQQQANQKLQEMMKETLLGLQEERELDITNSYEKLGGYDRRYFKEYVDKKPVFEKKVQYEVKTDITLVEAE